MIKEKSRKELSGKNSPNVKTDEKSLVFLSKKGTTLRVVGRLFFWR